jgi:hypothetical protein
MMKVQHERVLLARLTGYLVGRDAVIDLGRELDIVSQPDRVTFDQLVAGTGREEVEVMLDQMRRYADELEELERELAALPLPDTRWSRELVDSFAIDHLRARFVTATYDAVLAHLDGNAANASAHAEAATDFLAKARTVVQRRHRDLHDTRGRRLVDKTTNHTFYQYGYLHMADTLCYWDRELVQVRGVLGETRVVPPNCFF